MAGRTLKRKLLMYEHQNITGANITSATTAASPSMLKTYKVWVRDETLPVNPITVQAYSFRYENGVFIFTDLRGEVAAFTTVVNIMRVDDQ